MTYGAHTTAARWRAVRRRIASATATGILAAVLAVGPAAAAETDGALNGRISFTSFRDGQLGDIWTMNPDGTQLRKLTVGPLYDAQTDWSPDGQWIAFRRGPNASQRLGVRKMDLYGDRQQLLTEETQRFPLRTRPSPRRRRTVEGCCSARPCHRFRTPTSGRWTAMATPGTSCSTSPASSSTPATRRT